MTYTDSGRAAMVAALRREIFGPEHDAGPRKIGQPISLDPPPSFASWNDVKSPYHDAATGQEILDRDRPSKRYGVGVLYPQQAVMTDANEGEVADEEAGRGDEHRPQSMTDVPEVLATDTDDDDFDLSTTSEYRPSAAAVSFLAQVNDGDVVEISLTGARFERIVVTIDGAERDWFVRRPLDHTFRFVTGQNGRLRPEDPPVTEPLSLRAELLARLRAEGTLVTAAIVNEAPASRGVETSSLFQTSFTVRVVRDGQPCDAIIPYPDARSEKLLDRDSEARSLDLLYRKAPTFGVGHGCAATWDERWGNLTCRAVHATALPQFEAPSVTPDVVLKDGTELKVPLGPLAGYDLEHDGFASVQRVIDAYGEWIADLQEEAMPLTGHRADAAADHIAGCLRMHERMKDGLKWLSTDPVARRAFVLANRAILEQQLHFDDSVRATTVERGSGATVAPAKPIESWQAAAKSWRAFQIGFLVATARGAVIGDDEHRETVELIFFPTGGGKTEAYLGLAAFTLFHQRLSGLDAGTSVLMRYTLRLLTSQQFLRASALICAMEVIRTTEDDLAEVEPFSIGIWVGGSTTPNKRQQALSEYRQLLRGYGENPFLVLRCPWCAAQMGPVEGAKGVKKNELVVGYREAAGTIQFRCPDRSCPFSKRTGLPVFVIDDDVYDNRPSIVIGTIDKFAMLAFRPEARSLFGLGPAGEQLAEPPSLIIQDELHLISGPLGSMCGLYEPIIEQLCTASGDGAVRPKIIGSTATIRNYEEQIKGLYGREDAALFPPHGLDASDSFFAQHARDPDSGELAQGRLYVGVHAPGLGSIQTAQVRAGSALLQGVLDLPDEQQDPWWTSMMFFNSLRELGTSVSLLQSDIPDYLWAMRRRDALDKTRFLNNIMELTSRKRQDEIPRAIADLERPASSGRAVDVCLASNIIEVGIDISRLSLLTVLGQPKSTSQYIQVTGRVGRRWAEKPGLVVMIYSASRPRDRSHFEKFQSYHQRLYAEVEPVSVTPFSTPVLRRALHAAAIAHSRQTGPRGLQPFPMPDELFEEAANLILERAQFADPETVPHVKRELGKRRAEWLAWEPVVWDTWNNNDDGPLMRRAGEWAPPETREITWETPMSMRDVDAECRATITNRYAVARGDIDAEEDT